MPSVRRNEQRIASSVNRNFFLPWRGPSHGVHIRTSENHRATDEGTPRTIPLVADCSPAGGTLPERCHRTEFGASLTRDSTSTSDDKLSKHLLNCSLADDDDAATDGAAGVGVAVDAAEADANDAHGLDGRATGAGVVCAAGCVAGAAAAVLGSRGANTNSPSFTSLCCSLTHCQSAVGPVLNRTVNCA